MNTFTPQSGTGLNGLSNALAFLIYGSPNPVPSLTQHYPDKRAGVCFEMLERQYHSIGNKFSAIVNEWRFESDFHRRGYQPD